MAKKYPKPDKLHPKYTAPAKALARIVDELDGHEWDADTTETIARLCRLAGYVIRDVGERNHLAEINEPQAEPEAPKVWVVILEWNRAPSEVTGDPGLVGVYATLESAETAALAERKTYHEQGETVYNFSDEPEENWTIDIHVREAQVHP